jgi:hypothetical protein
VNNRLAIQSVANYSSHINKRAEAYLNQSATIDVDMSQSSQDTNNSYWIALRVMSNPNQNVTAYGFSIKN